MVCGHRPGVGTRLCATRRAGFIGKHTNLISRKFGNWIFLSEILTTLGIRTRRAGKKPLRLLHALHRACPTRAITAPFQLDARLCISYLTIQLKGSIPVELRPAIGNRIYGCDDCLAACPWNRFAQEGNLMKQHARQNLAMPDLLELLRLDEAAFKARFPSATQTFLITDLARFARSIGVPGKACFESSFVKPEQFQ